MAEGRRDSTILPAYRKAAFGDGDRQPDIATIDGVVGLPGVEHGNVGIRRPDDGKDECAGLRRKRCTLFFGSRPMEFITAARTKFTCNFVPSNKQLSF